MPFVFIWLIHLGVSVVYGLIISRLIAVLTKSRAVLTGGIIGLALYLLNLLVVSLVWRQLRGNEVSVLFTHVVFGLIAAGAYRGLLKRTASPIAPAP
jgi:hypothetical protein